MHTESTVQPTKSVKSPSPEGHYCGCEQPIPVERAERHGAAQRVCTRCGLPVAVRWRPR